MKSILKKLKLPIIALFLLSWVMMAVSFADDSYGPRRRGRRGGGYPVAEPAAIALLGAGLVSLGVYFNRKRKKK